MQCTPTLHLSYSPSFSLHMMSYITSKPVHRSSESDVHLVWFTLRFSEIIITLSHDSLIYNVHTGSVSPLRCVKAQLYRPRHPSCLRRAWKWNWNITTPHWPGQEPNFRLTPKEVIWLEEMFVDCVCERERAGCVWSRRGVTNLGPLYLWCTFVNTLQLSWWNKWHTYTPLELSEEEDRRRGEGR